MNVKVKVRNLSRSLPLPKYETEFSAGMDVMACFDCGEVVSGEEKPVMVKGYDWFYREINEFPVDVNSVVSIAPGERCLIPTGLKVEIPPEYEIQVRPRSGLAIKCGITVLNSPGTIDSDYRGMVGIILLNCGNEVFSINHGDKIAQIVLKEVPRIEWEVTESLSNTERGEGGFGHTSEDPNRAPSFQVGDQLGGVGVIKGINQDPVTHGFIYDVFTGDTLEKMSEQEILDILL